MAQIFWEIFQIGKKNVDVGFYMKIIFWRNKKYYLTYHYYFVTFDRVKEVDCVVVYIYLQTQR